MGLSFDCPHCARSKVSFDDPRFCVIFVALENPIDAGRPFDDCGKVWKRTGDTFETLTLSPSIDASKAHPDGWHGRIVAGMAEP